MPENLTLKDVMPIIGNPSRNNYFEVSFGGLSGGLSNHLRQRGVDGQFIADSMGLMCYEASLPGSSLATTESNNWQGYTENFAHAKIYNNLSLTFYCDKRYRALKFLEHWMEYSMSGNGTDGYALNNYQYRVKYPLDPQDGYKSNMCRIIKFENNYNKKQTLAWRKKIQWIPQDSISGFHPYRDMKSHILEPLKVHTKYSSSELNKELDILLDMVKLDSSLLSHYPHQLSAGQRQRANIARGLALKPKCLILDEPVASLDPEVKNEIIEELKRIRKQLGLTYFFISHDLECVKEISNRILVLDCGKLIPFQELESKAVNELP